MKRLFVVVMAFLMMQAFVCVWAKDAGEASTSVKAGDVLSDLVSDEKEISAVGYERHPTKVGEDEGYCSFFSAVREKEYIDRIVKVLREANVTDLSENKPYAGSKYYTEVIKVQYSDGTICKIDIDGNKMLVDGEEYRVYGLSGVDEIALEAETDKRPALEYEFPVYGLYVEGEILKLDGDVWYNGRTYGVSGEVVQESVAFDVDDVDIAGYILWLINSGAVPYDEDVMGEILHSRDVGTSFTVGFSNGSVSHITIDFFSAKRVLLSVYYNGYNHISICYMLPYDKAVEIAGVITDASDGTLESVDAEYASRSIAENFYRECERVENINGADVVGDSLDEICEIRFFDCKYADDKKSAQCKIYNIEGTGACAEVVKRLKSLTLERIGGAAFGGAIDYTMLSLTDGHGNSHLLYFTAGILKSDKNYYKYNFGEFTNFKKFMDEFEGKTVFDPFGEDMNGTALKDTVMALYPITASTNRISVSAENKYPARSREEASLDFGYETMDTEYLERILELLGECGISRSPVDGISPKYSKVEICFSPGSDSLEAFSDGSITYRGEKYYGDLTEFCKAVYELRAEETGKSLFIPDNVLLPENAVLDPYSGDAVSFTLKHKNYEVTVTDEDVIANISAFARNYLSFVKTEREFEPDSDEDEYELFAECRDGTVSNMYFFISGNNIIVYDNGTYIAEDEEAFTRFIRFFEFYAKSDSIKISPWAKSELGKAVSYGFCGIGDFSDDYSKKLTRLEVCDILVYPVHNIVGVYGITDASYYNDIRNMNVDLLTFIRAVDGKGVIEVDGAVWKRIFAPDDLVTREELAKMVCGIYRGGDYEYFSGYKADFELPEVTKTSFNDDGDISDWAKPYVEMAKNLGIFKGDDLGNFNPKANCTKEEVVAVAVRLYDMMLERV